jgi:Do/DeqQ family serine protease
MPLLTRRAQRISLALVAAGALAAGATWYTASLHAQTAAAHTQGAAPGAAAAPAITHAIAGGRDSYADIVRVVAPAVVTIRVEGKARVSPTSFGNGDEMFRRFFGDPFEPGQGAPAAPRTQRMPKQRGLGSGVVISRDGYIVTNNHVIDGADSITVEFPDGRTLSASVVGTDKPSDVALLKVKADDLQAIALGNSDAVQVGDVVLAVGNPLGVGQTVTMGIISAKGRATGTGDGSYEDFLQTDAPINHGNSGGALVNAKGELVGINSQILSNTGENIGIGFAIPANMARNVTDQLRRDGKVHRSQLGVTIQPVTSDMAASLGLKEAGGVIVSTVAPGSAADRAGIKQGDVIKAFNGQPVKDLNSLRNRVADSAPGSTATVTVARDGATRDLPVVLREAPASGTRETGEPGSAETDDRSVLGMSVAPLTPELANRLGVPMDVKGVVVQDVNPDGRAADAGLQPGDVVQQVNREAVQTADELRAAVRRNPDKPALLLISRGGQSVFLTVKPNA